MRSHFWSSSWPAVGRAWGFGCSRAVRNAIASSLTTCLFRCCCGKILGMEDIQSFHYLLRNALYLMFGKRSLHTILKVPMLCKFHCYVDSLRIREPAIKLDKITVMLYSVSARSMRRSEVPLPGRDLLLRGSHADNRQLFPCTYFSVIPSLRVVDPFFLLLDIQCQMHLDQSLVLSSIA